MARILVVDDEPDICDILREVLEHAGYVVDVATDGNGALRQLREAPADLLITDIFMPHKEGLETITEIRRDFPLVKVVAMSGGGLTGELTYLRDALQLGAIRSITKPFRSEQILSVVREALGS